MIFRIIMNSVQFMNTNWITGLRKIQAFFPRLYETGMRNTNYAANVRAQTKYLTNGAYLRVKNLTLGYTIPQECYF